ncbi:hypothetical protein WKI65_31240 [Streptomyces sp. MS1.AVA.3]
MALIRRHEYADPTAALRAMQELAARILPAADFRHIGDPAWS